MARSLRSRTSGSGLSRSNMKNYGILAMWILLGIGLLFVTRAAITEDGPQIEWKRVAMDGHRVGAKSVTMENVNTALGTFTDEGYIGPNGVVFPEDSPVPEVASILMEAQPRLSGLKVVVHPLPHAGRCNHPGGHPVHVPLQELHVLREDEGFQPYQAA